MPAEAQPAHAGPPARPYVPPLLWATAALIVSARAVLGRNGMGQAGFLLLAAFALGGVILAVKLPAFSGVGLALVAALAGAVLAQASLGKMAAASQALEQASGQELTVTVVSDPATTSVGWQATASARLPDQADVQLAIMLPESLAQDGSGCPVKRGDVVRCRATFSPNGDDSYGVSRRMRGICGSARVKTLLSVIPAPGALGLVLSLRESCARAIGAHEPGPAALIGGCVLGVKDGLKADGADERFSVCGLSHLIAVSGSHLSIVASAASALLGRTRLRSRSRRLLLSLLLGLFVVLSGLAPSAIRSWIMCILGFGSERLGRRGHSLSAVCLAALSMVALNVGVVGELGFLLSVCCVASLCVFSPWTTYALERLIWGETRAPKRSKLRDVCQSLSPTLVCQTCSLPLTAPLFGTVSLVAPLSNVVVSALFTPMLCAGLLACVLAPIPFVGRLCLSVAGILANAVLWVVGVLASLPFASVSYTGSEALLGAAVVGVGGAILLTWPRVSRKRVLCCLVGAALVAGGACLKMRYFSCARVVVLDVGQGDAILVQDGPAALLIDAGPEGALAQALQRENVLHLDGALITHQHADHVAGLTSIEGGPRVDETFVAEGVAERLTPETRAAISSVDDNGPAELRLGDSLSVGRFTLEVVWPNGAVDGTENAHSICLKLSYQDEERRLVGYLTGDAEQDVTAAIMAQGHLGNVDFLKVGHHGSAVSITRDEAQALDPEVSVASAGAKNVYGHPAKECQEALEQAGSLFLCTKDTGDVTIEPGEDGPVVTTSRKEAKP